MADDVAVGMDRWVAAVDGALGIGERFEHLVLHDDRVQRAPAGLGVIRRDRGDRFADVAHEVAREHRLVLLIRPYVGLPGTSSAVTIASTPSILHAGVTSMRTMRAYGCGERSVAPHRNPSAERSPENANEPCTLAMPSGRGGLSPSRPLGRRCRHPHVVVVLISRQPAKSRPAKRQPAVRLR